MADVGGSAEILLHPHRRHWRKTRGIAWFKDTATEHLAHMHQINAVLEQYGHPVTMLSEGRIGYVIYEDEFQVVAEPFSDTPTG